MCVYLRCADADNKRPTVSLRLVGLKLLMNPAPDGQIIRVGTLQLQGASRHRVIMPKYAQNLGTDTLQKSPFRVGYIVEAFPQRAGWHELGLNKTPLLLLTHISNHCKENHL